jgi:prepilin-type processing-associated H-X9-DG protein
VQKVRKAANKVSCQNNLHQIGIAFANYETSLGVYPTACQLPDPKINTANLPAIYDAQALGPFVEGNQKIWQCPADGGQAGCQPTDMGGGGAAAQNTAAGENQNPATVQLGAGNTYYGKYGTSYEYPMSRFAGKALVEITRGNSRPTSTMFLMYDYAGFHDAPGLPSAIVVLYLDGHVQ